MAGNGLAALVRAAQGGDETAQEALLQRAAKLAYARAWKLTASDDRAQDAAQDALVSVLRALPQLRVPTAFLAWLRTIVDNAVAAQGLRRSRQREEPLSVAHDLPDPESTADAAEQQAMIGQVRRAMAMLPSRDRVVVELFYFESMSCRQVAEFLYLTTDAVKMILHRARTRLRKEITTMTAADDVTQTGVPRIMHIMRQSDPQASRDDLMFGHDSRTAHVYMGLYPLGEDDRVAQALALSRAEVDAELAWLAARKLIAKENGRWRCVMPVMLDRDLAIIRPWAQQAVAPILAKLDNLHRELLGIAGDRPENARAQTIVAAGLYDVTAMRSFWGLMEKLAPASPDHGEWGKPAVAAAAVREGWPEGYNGHRQSSDSHTDERGARYAYFLWPHGVDRAAMAALLESIGEDVRALDPEEGLLRFLVSLKRGPVSHQEAASRAAESGVRATDVDGLLSELLDLGALRAQNGQLALAVPHVAVKDWQPFVDEVDAIGAQVTGAVADAADDLRARLVRCSFADCDFTESVYLCVCLAAELVSEAIRKREWVRFPELADFSWGVLLVS